MKRTLVVATVAMLMAALISSAALATGNNKGRFPGICWYTTAGKYLLPESGRAAPDAPEYNRYTQAAGTFVAGLRTRRLHLLPYHQLGSEKHQRLGQADPMAGYRAPDPTSIDRASALLDPGRSAVRGLVHERLDARARRRTCAT